MADKSEIMPQIWDKLTKEEKARLKWAYGTTPKITPVMVDTNRKSLKKTRGQKKKNKEEKKNG